MAWSDAARAAAVEARRRKMKGVTAKQRRTNSRIHGASDPYTYPHPKIGSVPPHANQMRMARDARRAFERKTWDWTNNPDTRSEASTAMRQLRAKNPKMSRTLAYVKAIRALTKRYS